MTPAQVETTARQPPRRKEERFLDFAESLLQNSDEVFFWCDPNQTTPSFVSDAYERIWGRSCESAYAKPSSWIESLHPEDREYVLRNFARAGAAGATQIEYRILRPSGEIRSIWTRLFPVSDPAGGVKQIVGIAQDCTERRQAEKTRAFLASIVESSDDSIVGTDLQATILSFNQAAERLFGYTAAEAIGQHITILFPPESRADYLQSLSSVRRDEPVERFESVRIGRNGQPIDVLVILSQIRDSRGQLQGVSAIYRDIGDRKRAEREREGMELQLRHAQKLESIGQLAAGIAHEINTPMQYIGDNARFLKDAYADLGKLIRLYQGLLRAACDGEGTHEAMRAIAIAARSADEEYLLEEIPKAIDQTLEGVNSVSTLVRAMKEFSHPGTKEKTPVNLNSALDSTIAVSRNEWKYVATLETDYDTSLPPIPCLPGDLNQVFLNVIVNAAHAIASVVKDNQRGKITVRTRKLDDCVEIQVQDTGSGIPEASRNRIFDPFFTTKEVGKGSGQGLAIARNIVVDKHGGSIHFETETGKGTTFIVRLPLDGSSLSTQ